jgi:EmrB/QacA subfamily drug resistance transporter
MPGNRPLRRGVILATCCLSLFLVTMDITIVNLALPEIGRDLRASLAGLQWCIDGYTLVIASFLVLAGSIADRFGRRRVFQIGLVLFSAGSLLCSFAPSIETLVAARVVQAFGGAMLNPVAMSIIVNVFTEPRERARVIGIWGGVVGVSMAIGPVLGGFLVQTLGWKSIFWINVPIAALALVLTRTFVPESRAEHPRRLDPVGQVLVVVALGALTFSLIEGRRMGWGSAPIAGGIVVTVLAVIAFVTYERRTASPLIDPRFFRSLPFSTATLLAVIAFSIFNGALFLSSLYLQQARGLSPQDAGFCLLPIALALLVFSPLSGRLVGAERARIALVAAGLCFVVSGALLVGVRVDTPLSTIIASFAFLGTGFGLINAPITNAAVSGMPRAQAGVAAALASTSRQIGITLGVAVAGAVAGTSAADPAFSAATHAYWWWTVAGGVLVAVIGIVATTAYARATTHAIRPLLEPGFGGPGSSHLGS